MSLALATHPDHPAPPGLRVTAEARREGGTLHLAWHLTGPAALPGPAAAPARLDDLWMRTCFEAFLASPEAPGYWEINLAPSGDWNLYRLTGYRAGMVEEAALPALPFTVERRADGCDVALRLDVGALGLGDAPWHLAIATVVEAPDGGVSYWALSHPGDRPDFHLAGAFVLPL